ALAPGLGEDVEVVAPRVSVAEKGEAAHLDPAEARPLDEQREQADQPPALAHAQGGLFAALPELVPPGQEPFWPEEHGACARALVQGPPFVGAGRADSSLDRRHLDHARLAHRSTSRTQPATCSASAGERS